MSNAPHGNPAAPAPVESLARELNATLAALRASLESCRDEAAGTAEPRARTLESALDQLGRLAQKIHTLVDVARPTPLAPLRCSVQELVGAALRGLAPAVTARVRVGAVVEAHLQVDGPVVTRCLAYLLQSAAGEGSGPIDLVTRRSADEVHFEVSASLEPRGAVAGDELQLAALALGLARRDVERSAGRLVVAEESADALYAAIVLPAVAGPAREVSP